MSDLHARIARSFETTAVPSLGEYVAIECLSPAFDPSWESTGAIEAAVQHLVAWARSRKIADLAVSIQRLEGRTPVIVIDVGSTGDDVGTALLYGHLDKQPPLGSWSEGLAPFVPVRRGDLLFGRGTADDGYSLYSALIAIEALEAGGLPHGRCVLLIEASEESGSPDLEVHLDQLVARLGDVNLVVCLDSGALDFDRLWITSSLRGNLVITVQVEVLTHGVHSGEASGVVPSSFRILRQLLDRIEDPETGETRVDELRVQPPAHLLAAAATLADELDDPLSRAFPAVSDLALMGRDGADRLIRQSWSTSVSVIGIDGVPSVAEGGNVLRPSTTAKLSIRIPPSVDAHAAQDAVVATLRAAPPSGATVSVHAEQPAQGWVAAPLAPWLKDAVDEASTLAFGRPAGVLGEGGSIPFLAALGIRFPEAQFVATGVLGPGSNAHGPDESLHIPCAISVTTALGVILSAHARRSRR